jgi:alkylglycerol monooxygenase
MEAYAQALQYAIPFFLILILIEAIAASRMGMSINRGADTISSLSSGVTNVVKDVLGLSIAIISYSWLLGHLRFYEIKASWAVYTIAFIVKDFAGYWVHRLEHEVNVLWNRHIIHHSSEEFNLSVALRQSISSVFSFVALFMIPAALLGVPAQVFAIVAPLHLFAQFWYHTRLIGRLGLLETFLVTPSHHRVHHAMNPEYLDKNYGQIFIIWDKLFGTFQPELDEVPPVYGVKRPVRTWNPVRINFQHLWLLIRDAWYAQSWWDKLRIWWMPTGWRPADVAARYPVETVEDLSTFSKYDPQPSQRMIRFAWIQLIVTLGLMWWMFSQIATIPLPYLLVYGAWLVLSVYSYTTLLDRDSRALITESLRCLSGLALILIQGGDWFGLGALVVAGPWLVAIWLILSLGWTVSYYRGGQLQPVPVPPGR